MRIKLFLSSDLVSFWLCFQAILDLGLTATSLPSTENWPVHSYSTSKYLYVFSHGSRPKVESSTAMLQLCRPWHNALTAATEAASSPQEQSSLWFLPLGQILCEKNGQIIVCIHNKHAQRNLETNKCFPRSTCWNLIATQLSVTSTASLTFARRTWTTVRLVSVSFVVGKIPKILFLLFFCLALRCWYGWVISEYFVQLRFQEKHAFQTNLQDGIGICGPTVLHESGNDSKGHPYFGVASSC